MSFLGSIRRIVLLYASMFNKRDDSLWIFGSWFGHKYADNPRYLFEYCIKNKINAYWITDEKEIYDRLLKDGYPVLLNGTKEAKKICSSAKYVVGCTSVQDANKEYIGGAVLINLWHGLPLKKVGFDDEITRNKGLFHRISVGIQSLPLRNEYLFSTSPEVTKIYMRCFKKDRDHVIEIGQARNDCFFDGSLKRRKFSENDIKYNIVYMPTHRNEGKTPIEIDKIFDLKRLDDYCRKNNCLFIIKKHFYHRNEIEDLSGYTNIVDFTKMEMDPQELLFNTDILISDYSSCYIDYLLLNRHVIFYCYDKDNYFVNDREMNFDYDDATPGNKAYCFEDLMYALQQAVENPTILDNKYESVKSLFYSKKNQNIVCPNLVEAIKKL